MGITPYHHPDVTLAEIMEQRGATGSAHPW